MLNRLSKLLGLASNSNPPPSTNQPAPHFLSTALKYYVYISQTKVDMLFPQIPNDFLRGAEAEVKVTLGVASATLKSRSPEQANALSAKAAVLSSFIKRSEDVGDISRPGRWIAGSCSLKWGVVREYASDIVFFGGVIGDKRLALLGSRESLIGECKTAEAKHAQYYYVLKFFNEITEAGVAVDNQPPYFSYEDAIDTALKALPQRATKLEFLAKVLHDESNCLVASPLYVAVVE